MGPPARGHWAALSWGRGRADTSPSGSSDLLPREWPRARPVSRAGLSADSHLSADPVVEVTAVCDWVALPSSRPVGSAQAARHHAQESGDPGPARGWRLAQPQAGEQGGGSHRRPGNLGKSTWRPCSWNSPVVPAPGEAGLAGEPWPGRRGPSLPACSVARRPPARSARGCHAASSTGCRAAGGEDPNPGLCGPHAAGGSSPPRRRAGLHLPTFQESA